MEYRGREQNRNSGYSRLSKPPRHRGSIGLDTSVVVRRSAFAVVVMVRYSVIVKATTINKCIVDDRGKESRLETPCDPERRDRFLMAEPAERSLDLHSGTVRIAHMHNAYNTHTHTSARAHTHAHTDKARYTSHVHDTEMRKERKGCERGSVPLGHW